MRHSNPLTWASGTTLATLAATAAAALTRDRDTGTLGRLGRNAGGVGQRQAGAKVCTSVNGQRSMGGGE